MQKPINLNALLADVSVQVFGGLRGRSFRIKWGRRRRAAKTTWWGQYGPEPGLIRINPVLSDDRVPIYFVRYVIAHELLHAIVRARTICGRWYTHPPEFLAIERRLPGYTKAITWERNHSHVLFNSSP